MVVDYLKLINAQLVKVKHAYKKTSEILHRTNALICSNKIRYSLEDLNTCYADWLHSLLLHTAFSFNKTPQTFVSLTMSGQILYPSVHTKTYIVMALTIFKNLSMKIAWCLKCGNTHKQNEIWSYPIKNFCSIKLLVILHNRAEMRFCYMLLVLQQVMAHNE